MAENIIDVQIGKKLRQLRNMKGLSQSALADESGITFQQVQKYEKGVNRVSAARLFHFSQILGADVMYFFKDLDAGGKAQDKKYAFSDSAADNFIKQDFMESKETIVLVREYYKIKDTSKRKHIVEIIKAMSSGK